MIRFRIGIFAAIILMTTTSPALACDWRPAKTFKEMFERSDFAFTAQHLDTFEEEEGGYSYTISTFYVMDVYKGEQIYGNIRVKQGGSSCMKFFRRGEVNIILADRDENGDFRTSIVRYELEKPEKILERLKYHYPLKHKPQIARIRDNEPPPPPIQPFNEVPQHAKDIAKTRSGNKCTSVIEQTHAHWQATGDYVISNMTCKKLYVTTYLMSDDGKPQTVQMKPSRYYAKPFPLKP